MKILYLESVDSTHTYIKSYIKSNGYEEPICIYTQNQTNGIGSRNNSWSGKKGNLFFSFAIKKELLPDDLLIQSASIYFSFLLKEILLQKGSKVWLKWPNDFYIENKKIGGTITNFTTDTFYCGIGLNLNYINEDYGFLDINIEPLDLLKEYFRLLYERLEWKKIFSKYVLEFEFSKNQYTTINQNKISLKNTVLNEDGSISINEEKVYSLR